MKIARFLANDQEYWGVVESNYVTVLAQSIYEDIVATSERLPLKDVQLLAPVTPSKVVAIGLNYRDHAQEVNQPLPEEPFVFLKAPTSIVGPEQEILIANPKNETHHEAELAIVIGKRAASVPRESALEYVRGYTCGNDVSDRTIQRKESSPVRAKSFDTYTPLGPFLVTGIDPSSLAIECYVNGERRQSSSTSQLIFDVPTLVSFVSRSMTLLPGDVILTGTPSGVGPIKAGDVVEVRIEGIGTLRNPVRNR